MSPEATSLAAPPIVGRYRLDASIFRGEGGDVFRALDLVTNQAVALKLLPPGGNAPRFRAEVSALRLLRLPGVAQLLDEGNHGGRSFLVMELIDGAPFPGPRRGGWAQLWRPTVALLEILARVHDRGVVHRDLKPDNVLVDAEGRPTVLDFGLSTGPAIGVGAEETSGAVGTLYYVAPEQLTGGRVDARTDLYAFGAMLYEAVSGRPPHGDLPLDEFLQARLEQPPARLDAHALGMAPRVCAWIEALLSVDPEARPRSAGAALAALNGATPTPSDLELPWLGGSERFDEALAGLASGRVVQLVGQAGTGKTRALRELAERLTADGRAVVWLPPSREPLGGLLPHLAKVDAGSSLRATVARATAWVRETLARGEILLCDGLEQHDRWTQEVLRACTAPGSELLPGGLLLSAGAPLGEGLVLSLEVFEERDLRTLFAGPDRIFHLQGDGARELFRRTEGIPERVTAEVAVWERAGLARWSGAELVIDRTALGRLSLGLAVSPAVRSQTHASGPFGSEDEELLAWVALGRGRARTSWVAQALGRPAWRVEAALEELARAGALAVSADGRLEALVVPHAFDDWSPAKRARAHGSLSDHLRPGAPGRLLHLILAERPLEVPDEACCRARRLASQGLLSEAEAVLTVGLGVARQLPHAELGTGLLDEWCAVALADFSPQAIDRVLFELAREARREGTEADRVRPHLRQIEALLGAALATLRGARRALDQLEAVPPFGDQELERWRQALRAQAARRASPEREAAVVADIQRVWGQHPSALIQASLDEWQGRLAYRQGDYAVAARRFEAAARRGPRASLRLSAMLNGASALLELGELERAEEVGSGARDLAAACRHPLFEVRAEWILRAARYRRGAAGAPDLELVDAAARVGVPDQEALIALNEAAMGWRAGHPSAAGLAGRAGSLWAAQGKLFAALLCRALQLLAGPEEARESGELEELWDAALDCDDLTIQAQILALLRWAGVSRPRTADEERLARTFRGSLGGASEDARLELLSPKEVLAALSSTASASRTARRPRPGQDPEGRAASPAP